MKERFMAFNTKDQTSRDVRRDQVFIPRLTGHSGKSSEALAEEMKIRKHMKVLNQSSRDSKIISHTETVKTPGSK